MTSHPRRPLRATSAATSATVRAVDGVSFEIDDGEFFAMLGPSGSGKTTCLRLIAGFEQPDARQRSRIHGDDVSPACRPTSATSTPCSRTTRCSRT